MKQLAQEGGMTDDGMAREPVTGNEIPPGSLASEVRDDVPAQLSGGEYIVPADVLRFFGVRFFEDLRSQAKQGLMQMESEGRIGGTPVDAQGAPLEGLEEELTPEEEQMLQEALGAAAGAPTGMAVGGMVPQQQQVQMQQMQPAPTPYQDQATLYKSPMGMAEGGMTPDPTQMAFARPTFDRTQFTSDTGVAPSEVRKYINPQTKEVRDFTFLNGMSLSAIPVGFVPWTQELQNQANTPQVPVVESIKKDRKDNDRSASQQRALDKSMGITDTQDTSAGSSLDDWAKENYEAFTSDPYNFGVNAINNIEPRSGISKVPVIGKVVGLGSDLKTLNNISDARAALGRLDPNSQQAKDLSARIDKAVEGIGSNLIEMGAAVVARGGGKIRAIEALEESNTAKPSEKPRVNNPPASARQASPAPSAGTPPARRSSKGPTASDRARAAGAASAQTPTTPKKPATGTKVVNTPSGPKTVVSRPKARPASKPKPRSQDFSEGGLVSRPTKK